MVKSFRLARMSPLVLTLTLALLALPLAFFVGPLFGRRPLAVPALFIIAIYAWVWLRFRPSRFIVHPGGLQVIWPLKRREIPREDISNVRLIDRRELCREIGWGMRVGAGGLWGGFGWLWTKRRGIVEMYVSRTDRFVWIERAAGRPWLITPEDPDTFVRACRVSPELPETEHTSSSKHPSTPRASTSANPASSTSSSETAPSTSHLLLNW